MGSPDGRCLLHGEGELDASVRKGTKKAQATTVVEMEIEGGKQPDVGVEGHGNLSVFRCDDTIQVGHGCCCRVDRPWW